jgi:hypothetical protein
VSHGRQLSDTLARQPSTSAEGSEAFSTEEQPADLPQWRRVLNHIVNTISLMFTVLEFPLVVLRRVTIPLVEAEGYSWRWFLASLVGAPPAVALYLEYGWQVQLVGACVGTLLAVGAALLLGQVGLVSPSKTGGVGERETDSQRDTYMHAYTHMPARICSHTHRPTHTERDTHTHTHTHTERER